MSLSFLLSHWFIGILWYPRTAKHQVVTPSCPLGKRNRSFNDFLNLYQILLYGDIGQTGNRLLLWYWFTGEPLLSGSRQFLSVGLFSTFRIQKLALVSADCHYRNYSVAACKGVNVDLTSVVNKQEHSLWMVGKGATEQRGSNKNGTDLQQDHKNDRVDNRMAVMSDLKQKGKQRLELYCLGVSYMMVKSRVFPTEPHGSKLEESIISVKSIWCWS